MNGVALSPSSHVTSGTEGATSTASLWTPAASPPNSLKSAPSSDCPLNLTVSRTTRRLLSPPCPSADARTAAGSVSRRQAEDSPVHGSPPPAHHPYTVAKSDNLTARKSAIPNNEVLSSCQCNYSGITSNCLARIFDIFVLFQPQTDYTDS